MDRVKDTPSFFRVFDEISEGVAGETAAKKNIYIIDSSVMLNWFKNELNMYITML